MIQTTLPVSSDFATNGYVFKKGLFNAQEITDLRAALLDAQRRVEERSRLDKSGLLFKHNLFLRSESLRAFVSQRKIVHFLRDIIGPDFWVRWDQTVDKQPGGEEFPWHQDNGYNGLLDGHFQLWVAITEMTAENGGLWVQRGSHRGGNMPHVAIGNHLVCEGDPKQGELVRAEPGDAMVFSSFLLHRTAPNATQKPRVAYVIEYMSLDHFDPYIDGPYFVAARGGEPAPEFVNFYRGRLNPWNQLKYAVPRMQRGVRSLRVRMSDMIKRRPSTASAGGDGPMA